MMWIKRRDEFQVKIVIKRQDEFQVKIVIKRQDEFQVKIGGAFEHLLECGDRPVEKFWLDFKDTRNEITEKVFGFRCKKQVVNLPLVLSRERGKEKGTVRVFEEHLKCRDA